jgi:hypothetical protein
VTGRNPSTRWSFADTIALPSPTSSVVTSINIRTLVRSVAAISGSDARKATAAGISPIIM